MLIYQTKPTNSREPKQAIVIDSHRWAYIVEGDIKIEWKLDFSRLSEAFGHLGYYEMDGSGYLISDAKGIPILNREWQGEIHEDVDKLVQDLFLEETL